MAVRLIEVVRDDLEELSTERLEAAQAALLRSRISGAPVKVTHSFIQALINDILRARASTRKFQEDLDKIDDPTLGVDELDESDGLTLATPDDENDFGNGFSSDEESVGEFDFLDDEEIDLDDASDTEIFDVGRVAPRRSSLAHRRTQSGFDSLSFLKLTVISIVAIIAMTAWVIVYG